MKKNLFVLVFTVACFWLCSSVVSAKPLSLSADSGVLKNNSANQRKLKKVELILKNGRSGCKRNQDCLDRLEQIEGNAAMISGLCGFWSFLGLCQHQINYTLALGEAWEAAGCSVPGTFTVTGVLNQKKWIIKNKETRTS